MLNKNQWVLALLCACIGLCSGCSRPNTPPSIVKLEKQYPDLRKNYVYQSVLRLANVKQDPDFENLIKDVRKVILYLPPKNDSTYQITAMRTDIRTDGYEELIDVRTNNAQRISLWVKESNAKSHYIALVDSDSDDIILEIDGEIHPEYLSSIKLADEGSLLDLLKGGF